MSVATEAQTIVAKLNALGVPCRLVDYLQGPQINRAEIEPGEGVRMHDFRKISRADDLAFAIGSESVSISAPIPGRALVGIEWARKDRALVTPDNLPRALRPLTVPIGLDVENRPTLLLLDEAPHAILAGQTGAGKALALDTRIQTADGWTTMGDIQVGTEVFDENGKPCTVLAVGPIQYERPCYEIEFSDRATIVADAEHEWLTWTAYARNSEGRARVHVPTPEFPWAERTRSALDNMNGIESDVTAREIAEELGVSHGVAYGATKDIEVIGTRTVTMTQTYGSKIVHKQTHAQTYSRRAILTEILRRAHGYGSDQSHKRPRATIVTTQEIRQSLRVPALNNRTNHSVKIADALERQPRTFKIDPYVLGVWLGDGTSTNNQITSADPEVLNEMRARGYKILPTTEEITHKVVGLRPYLKQLDLLGNKHIPREYLLGSIEQRQDLLAGLMDSDGGATKSGSCEFYNTSLTLINDTYDLICSLGLQARIRTKEAKLYDKECGPTYTISFTTSEPVFKLPRKGGRQYVRVRSTQEHRYIVDVRPVKSVPVRCIEVDSPSHLFLVGRECIPTHNSSLLHTILCGLIAEMPPEELRLCLVDLKRVEMSAYEDLPHLLFPVADDAPKALDQLHALALNMDDRYRLLQTIGARDIKEANAKLAERGIDPLPYFVCAIDELSELMMTSKKEVESLIVRLCQKGRAAGIHLILATQYPKAEVLSGLIRVNAPTKICLAVPDMTASRVVIDRNGGEKLLGRGDGLLSFAGLPPIRFQSAFCSPEKVAEVVSHWTTREEIHV